MSWIARIGDWIAHLIGMRQPPQPEAEFIWRPVEPATRPSSPPPASGAASAPTARSGLDSLRFGSTATDHTERPDVFAAIRAKLRTAYTPAQPVTNRRMFAGRTKVLASLVRAIEDQRLHAVIYGERGLGKTSMLHVLAQTARDARYLVVYITCSAGSTFEETFRALCAAIPVRYHEAYGPTSPEAEQGATLADVLGEEPITNRSASDLLARVAGARVLVILDEFDRAGSDEFRRAIAELLKSLSDRAARVQFLIAGVAGNLTELVANVPSIQRNIFALQVPKMTPDEVRDLVKNGEGVSGLSFDDGAIHAIVERSIGFPFLATLLSHRSALVAIDHGRIMASAADVTEATSEVVDEFRGRMSRRAQTQIDQCVSRGLLAPLGVLAGVAQTVGGWFTPADIQAVHGSPQAIAAAPEVARELASQQLLLETRPESFEAAFHFWEESVPPYLWLLAFRGPEHDEPAFERSSAV